MNKKVIFIALMLFISILFFGCVNKNIVDKNKTNNQKNNDLFDYPQVKKILESQKNDPNYNKIVESMRNDPNYLVKIDDIVENDGLIYFCKDDKCFFDRYKNCEDVQIIKDNLIYVVFGISEENEQKCQILLDRKYFNRNSLKCFFKRADLTELLFKNLTGEKNTEIEQNIIKESCKEIKL